MTEDWPDMCIPGDDQPTDRVDEAMRETDLLIRTISVLAESLPLTSPYDDVDEE